MSTVPLSILSVEDRADDTELISEELARFGLEHTIHRVDSEDALRTSLSSRSWDLVISDHMLPGFGGHRALEIVLSTETPPPFIVVSGTIGEEAAVDYMRAGAADYVLKDNLSRLGPAVQREVREFRSRLRQRQVVRRSEGLARAVIRNIPDGAVFLFDQDLRYLLVGGAALAEAGYSEAGLVGKTIWQALPAEEAEALAPLYEAALAGRSESQQSEYGDRVYDIRAVPVPIDGQEGVVGLLIVWDITEREEAAERLRESEERYRSLFQHAPVGLGLADIQGHILALNEAMLEPGGYTPDDLRAIDNVHQLYADETTRDRLLQILEDQGFVAREEVLFKRRDGGSYPAHASLRPVSLDGRPCVLTMVEDISAQKEAEVAQQASEARLRELVNATFEGIAFAADGVVLDGNAQFAHMFGYDLEEIVGMTVAELVAPEDRELVMSRIRAEFQGAYRVRGMRKDGTIFPVEARGRAVVRGGADQRVKALRDLSDVEAAQGALDMITTRQNTLLDMVSVCLYTCRANASYVTTWISENARAVTGFAAEQFVAESDFWQSRIHTQDAAAVVSSLGRQLAAGDDYSCEYRWMHADGTYHWHLNRGRAMRDDAGEVTELVGTFQDVSHMKALQRQLAGAQRMEAVGRLAGGVAHDFNNLLTVIQAFSGFVLEGLRPTDPDHADLLEVVNAAERGAALTRQLLAFSRQQTIEPELISLAVVLDGLQKMLTRLLGEDVECTTVVEPDSWPVLADPGAIEQVLVNLAVNSRDAMPKGGKLTIELKNVTLDEGASRQHDAMIPPGDYVLVAVSDNGDGMDEETRERIFEPFFSTKGDKGTGLGLSTCYGIVKQAGGFIWVYSELGVGTTFRVYLPRSADARETTRTSTIEPSVLSGNETILVAEDEPSVRALAVRALSRLGYTVLAAANGGEGLLICEQHAGKIDLLLTDVVMPRMSGAVLVERVAPLRPEMKVLYMTGYTDEAVVRHGILQAGVELIQKPFSPRKLAERVRLVLDAAPTDGPPTSSTS